MKRYFKKVQLTEYYIVTAGNNKEAETIAIEGFNKDIKNNNIETKIVELRERLQG
jgi:hypothetical protein